MKLVVAIPKRAVLAVIRFYQRTLSPDTGFVSALFPFGYCKFHPTCSAYTYQAIEHHGLIRGSSKGIWRILRCNPFTKGGFDTIV